MPKVLRIINRFNLGGPTFNAAYLTKYLEPDFQTLLVGGQKDPSEEGSEFIAEELGLKPLVMENMRRSINVFNDYSVYRRIRSIIKDFKPDIVHTHASKAGAVGRFAAIHEKVPVIVHTFHGNVFKGYFGPAKTNVYKRLERYLARKSSAIIAISELQKQELVYEHKIAPDNKVHVISLGFNLSKFHIDLPSKRKSSREKWQIADDEILIGIVGRLVPVKNHGFLFKALKKIKTEHPELKWKLVIVGDGETRANLEQECANLGLDYGVDAGKQVIFTSWIKEIDVVNAGLDIAVLCSHNEGTPVSLIEAQAAGCPIVTTAVGGIRNIVIPGETALLSDPGDFDTFKENLRKMILSDDLRKTFSTRGWQFVEERFHYTRLVRETGALYTKLLEQKNRI